MDSSVSAHARPVGLVGEMNLKGNDAMVVDQKTRAAGLEPWRLPESEFVMYDEDEEEEGEFGEDEGFEGDDELGDEDEDFLEDDEELEGEEEFDDDDDDDL